MIGISQGSEYARDRQICVSMILKNAQLCLNMPKAEPKTTIQAK